MVCILVGLSTLVNGTLYNLSIYTAAKTEHWPPKNRCWWHITLTRKFAKWRPIFRILSLRDSQ